MDRFKRRRRDDGDDPPADRRYIGGGSSYRGSQGPRPASHESGQGYIGHRRHDSGREKKFRTGQSISHGAEDNSPADSLKSDDERNRGDYDRGGDDGGDGGDGGDDNGSDDGDDDGDDWSPPTGALLLAVDEKDNQVEDASTSVPLDDWTSEEWSVPGYISDDESDDASIPVGFDYLASEEWSVPEYIADDQSLDVPAFNFNYPAKERDYPWTDRVSTPGSGLTSMCVCPDPPDENGHAVGIVSVTINPSFESKPRFFRVSGIPPSWSEKVLLKALRNFDQSFMQWEGAGCQLSLYPSCTGTEQTALLSWAHPPLRFQCLDVTSTIRLAVSDASTPKAISIVIESNFCGLTPLNTPGTVIVAELVSILLFVCGGSTLTSGDNLLVLWQWQALLGTHLNLGKVASLTRCG